MVEAAFDGLRVVDFSDRLSGAWAARLFGDLGADVVLAEPSEGHALRYEPPFLDDRPGPERSLLHAYVNWNKRSRVVRGDADAAELAAGADLLVTTQVAPWPAHVAAAIAALPAAGVHLSITAHGLQGPLAAAPGNNLTACARSGWSHMTRYVDEPPLQLPVRQTGYVGGVAGFNAAAAALLRRMRGGGGLRADVSELEAVCATTAPQGLGVLFSGDPDQDYGWGGRKRRGEPAQLLQAADGLMNFGVGDWARYADAMHFLGLPDLADDPEYAPLLGRHGTDQTRLRSRLAEAITDRPCDELLHGLLDMRCITGVMRDMPALRDAEQLDARRYFVATEVEGRAAHAPGPIARMPQMPATLRRPAPRLGEHDGDVGPAATRSPLPSPAAGAAPANLPLAGVRVLAFTQAWAGTWGTDQLALLGADVVQIESPTRPDVWRGAGAPVPKAVRDPAVRQHRLNTSAGYSTVNLNKRSLTLDLKQPRGLEIFWQLLPKFDVVADNFSPHVMPSWGVDLDTLNAKRPGIIWASVSGYGATGPFAEYGANGATIEPMAGLSSIHGYEGDSGANTGALLPDPASGYYFAAAILGALCRREREGGPIRIDAAMQEIVALQVGDAVLEYEANGVVRRPTGNRHPRHAPHNFYAAQDGEWLALAAESDAAFAALAAHIGRPELAGDDRFAGESARKANEAALDAIVGAWCAGQDARRAEAELGAIGVCAARAARLSECFGEPGPQFRDRGYLQRVTHPETGTHWMPVGPWRLGGAAIPTPAPAPCFGEHSREVLAQELGLGDAAYEELVACGVTGAVHAD